MKSMVDVSPVSYTHLDVYKRQDQMKEMQKQYDVTWDYCRTSMVPIGKKYGIDAVFALTKAEDLSLIHIL